MSWIPGFGIRKIGNILFSVNPILSKLNQTIHGSAEAAAKTTEHIKSGANGIMTAKGVKDCVVASQCNDYVYLTVSTVGTIADVSNHICRNVPGLKRFTPIKIYMSVSCKYFVHLCRTGNITFSCNNLVE
jgi:hypothetical protein